MCTELTFFGGLHYLVENIPVKNTHVEKAKSTSNRAETERVVVYKLEGLEFSDVTAPKVG